MIPVIYFRESRDNLEEAEAARKYFKVVNCRSEIPSGSLVIPRYSALPFYAELEKDVSNLGSRLINPLSHHNYVAKISSWYNDFEDLTFKTYFSFDQIPEGRFVVKGETNSRKFDWNKSMYADSRKKAIEIGCDLMKDGLIGDQKIVFREYMPLKVVAENMINGLPSTEEYRFFCFNGEIVAKGFYWSNIWDDLDEKPDVNSVPEDLINKICKKLGKRCNFSVFDLAKTQKGDWMLVELNDGCMSGLSMIDPDKFYSKLSKILNEKLLD